MSKASDMQALFLNINQKTANAFLKKYSSLVHAGFKPSTPAVAEIMAHKLCVARGPAAQAAISAKWLRDRNYRITIDPSIAGPIVPDFEHTK